MHVIYSADDHKKLQQKNKMLFATLLCAISLLTFSAGYLVGSYLTEIEYRKQLAQSQVQGEVKEKEYPLLKYSFSELEKRGGIPSEITIVRELEKNADFTAYVFYYKSEGRKISGQLNVPRNTPVDQPQPIIVMLRGFVPLEEYQIGKGSKNSSAYLAKNGFITIAPDFLGFGESDPPPGPTLAERFVKPANVLDLLASIEQNSLQPLTFQKKNIATIDTSRLGLWGHSNGGQISISILEITKRSIPTVLWAPVTKEFPYSVLYFTDEDPDGGKGLRGVIAKFEDDYDIQDFTIDRRLDQLTASIQLHQGTLDDAVPKSWSDDFYSLLVGKGKKEQIEYFVYEGANHGLYPPIETVLERTKAFFDTNVKNKPEPTPTPLPSATPTPQATPFFPVDATESAVTSTPSATLTLQPSPTARVTGTVRNVFGN